MRKILLIIFSLTLIGGENEWSIIRVVKSQEVTNILFLPSDMVFDEDGNVFISDIKGCFIRKYSFKGRLLKEIGRKGKGPGEFEAPYKLYYFNGKLYVWDIHLKRMSVFNKKLRFLTSFSLPYNIYDFFVVNKKIIASVTQHHENFGLVILGENGKILKKTFKKLPSYIKGNEKWLFLYKVMHGFLLLGYNPILKSAVAAFRGFQDGNYLYFLNSEGEIENKIPLNLFRGYKMPKFLLKIPLKFPLHSRVIYLESIHLLDDGSILLGLSEKKRNRKQIISIKTILALLRRDGSVKTKKILPGYWKIYEIHERKMLVRNFNDEDEIFEIWEMR